MTNGKRLDFRNVNTLWASLLAETLNRLGLNTAIIGSIPFLQEVTRQGA